ncbi:DNA polymerase III subunit epsilon [Hoeflea sp. BAL378]|uniref:DUF294 nucleotidyltransferase-like domain-containing protein n=1 Tax=Hoeflea sp. BAL378 TaxID=1547437 RepID=UPI0005147415|nr:DUF294 nucleotidyltransferase-like domain-containing protein [Hoeflea sp. BAL378]KGF70197.1 DNA polymerase III subunit epsilon [Hoeflea sp. BAL378]
MKKPGGVTRNQHGPATPLIALDTVVLDTETTGLDVRQDRLVQIAAVRLHGADILEHEVFDVLLDPGVPIPEVATRIHGIGDADVEGRQGFAAIAPELAGFIGDSVVIGHSIHFDMAVLRHEALRHGLTWKEPQAIDVGLVAAGLQPGLVDTSLDSLAAGLGIAISGRHSALGDAMATARVYVALLPQLLKAGVRSLGEIEALCRKPSDLIARQESAGWFARPGSRPDFTPGALRSGAQKAIDSFLYRHRLGEVMSSPPITVSPEVSLHAAARLMTDRGIGCLMVEPGADGRFGILTERDVLSAMAEAGAGAAATTVGAHMTSPVISAPADMLLYRTLGLMARRNLRYLGVTDSKGELAGVFTLRTLLRERALATLTIGDEIAAASRPRELAKVQAALPSLAASLLAEGLDAREAASVISAEGRAMTARAAEIAETEMIAAGHGPAPADYALLVLGSGGRGESLLAPDQDNALVIADGYDGDLESAEDWFTRFATRITEILDRAGIPYCTGGVMAKNRAWRRSLSEWQASIDDWVRHPTPQSLLNVDIFYDFTPVHASGSEGARIADRLRGHATAAARSALGMLRAMGETAGGHSAPLGLFGRIRKDDAGRVDLKSGALLPIVAGARVIALRHGVAALDTPGRLTGAARAAGRAETDAALLSDIHGFLIRLILAQQIADIQAGVKPSNRVEVNRLSHQDAAQLREALGRIDLIRDMLRDLLQGV